MNIHNTVTDLRRGRYLRRRRKEISAQIGRVGEFIRGSIVVLRRPCTHRPCRKCQSGEKHAGLYLSVSIRGKTRLFYLPKAVQGEARRLADNYKKLRRLVEEANEIDRELLLEGARRRKVTRGGM